MGRYKYTHITLSENISLYYRVLILYCYKIILLFIHVFFFRLGFLYSFITTWLPIYSANVLGGDAVRNGVPVSVTWIVGWITSIIAGISAGWLTNVDTFTKTTVTKMYVGIVLIGSPIMLFGAMVAGCNGAYVKTFTRTSIILLGFERSSIRINSMDLCPGK